MSITFSATPFSCSLSWPKVSAAAYYSVEYKKSTASLYSSLNKYVIIPVAYAYDLSPLTTYHFRVYSWTSGTATLAYEADLTTAAATVGNFNKAALLIDGVYDLRYFTDANASVLGATKAYVENAVMATSDPVKVTSTKGTVDANVVKLSETLPVVANVSVYAPFDSAVYTAQSVSLTLRDASTVSVSYDAASEKITIGGVDYYDGQNFTLDGQRCTVAVSQ